MKRRKPHALSRRTDERLHALAHFLRRLVGKSDRQHFVRARMAIPDEIGDAERDDSRLSRSRSREDQQRTVTVQDCVALLGVELFQERHWGRVHYIFAVPRFAVRSSRFAVRGVREFAVRGSRFVHRRSRDGRRQEPPDKQQNALCPLPQLVVSVTDEDREEVARFFQVVLQTRIASPARAASVTIRKLEMRHEFRQRAKRNPDVISDIARPGPFA